jgi:hypothetical protein
MREPMTYRQIGEALGMTAEEAHWVCQYAIKKLRKQAEMMAEYRKHVYFATDRPKNHYERLEDMA